MPFNNVINEKAYYGNNDKYPHFLFSYKICKIGSVIFILRREVAYGKGRHNCASFAP